VKDPADPLLTYEGEIQDVAVTSIGFYALGHRDNDFGTVTTFFYSADGRSWRLHSEHSAPLERSRPLAFTRNGSRFVVVGIAADGAATDGRIWTYDDVRGWVRVDPTSLGLAGPGFQNVGTVAWHPTLGFVVGGATWNGTAEVPTVWHSMTGETWERLPTLEGGVAAVHDIAVVPGGFVAAGSSNAGPRVWRSSDGRTWSSVPTSLTGTTAGKEINVASDGSKIVYGVTADTGSQLFHRVGSEWLRADRGPGFPYSKPRATLLLDVAATRGRVVAVGSDGNGKPLVMVAVAAATQEPGTRIKVWSRPPGRPWSVEAEVVASRAAVSRCADGPKGTVLVGGDENFAAVSWTPTRPGERWVKSVVGSSEPRTEILDVIRDGSGFLATGKSGGRGQADIAIWRSSDGAQWDRLAEADPITLEPGYQAGAGIVKIRDRVVVVGQHGAGNAGIWVGTP
jgi:hypothetical protein